MKKISCGLGNDIYQVWEMNMKIFRQINDKICSVEEIMLFFFGMILITSVALQVICRYLLRISTPWTEELARYMFCWIVPIGAGYCTARREHVEMGIINKIIERSKKRKLLSRIWFYVGRTGEIVFLVLFSMIYYKYLKGIVKYPQYSTVMHINMLLVMSAMFSGMILMGVQGFLLILDAALGPKMQINEVGK